MSTLATTVFAHQKGKIPLDAFIGYWKLGVDSKDSVGGLNGTNTNVNFISNSADFSTGTPSLVNFGDNDVFSFTDGTNDKPFSFCIHVNMGTIVDGTYYNIFSKQTSSSVKEFYLQYHIGGEFWLLIQNNTTANNSIGRRTNVSSYPISSNTWYRIIGTYDGSKMIEGVKLYVESVNMEGYLNTGTYTGMSNTTAPLRLGVINSNAFQFRGKQKQFALFNRVLTDKEIAYINKCMTNNIDLL